MRSSCRQNEGRKPHSIAKQNTRFKLRKTINRFMMPMMLAQEASIIDIIRVPFLLPKPSGAVLVFEAMLAGAPRDSCMQNGTCKGAHDALTSKIQNPSLRWGFPTKARVFGKLARAAEARKETEVS